MFSEEPVRTLTQATSKRRSVDGMPAPAPRTSRGRLAIVFPAGVLLLLGMYAGVQLLGVSLPGAELAERHSALMVFGFVTTLISLERAVALRKAWAFAAPLFTAAGAFLLLMPVPVASGGWMITLGVSLHALQYVAIWRRQPMMATAIQGLGATVGAISALLFTAGVPVAQLVVLFAVFLILTIAGERLELARLAAPGPAAEAMLLALSLLLATAALVSLVIADIAMPVAGVALLLMVAWLARFDIVRMTIKQPGLPSYVARCLYLGYGWLVVAGAGWLLGGAHTSGVFYDATTHAVFLGFVITAIMAHAPLILPAVLGVKIPYHPVMYVPVVLLQLSLLVRVVAGDAWGIVLAHQIGGIGSVVAILLFAVTSVTLSLRGARVATKRSATRVEA